jgi:hypothetical protein
VAQPPGHVGVVGERQLVQPADLVEVAQDELHVVVALRQQDGALAVLGRLAERGEHGCVAVDPPHAPEVARPHAELVRVHRDARDVHTDATEAARE